MIATVILLATGVGILVSHWKVRQYTRNRLRFVDAAHSPLAPVAAGLGATLLALPVVALVPVIGAGSAVLFGVGVGSGVLFGSRDVKRLPG